MTPIEGWLLETLHLESAIQRQAVAEARQRSQTLGMSEAEWIERARRDHEEVDRVLSVVAPPESWLFRHAAAFEELRERLTVLRGAPVRLLSLGCARGAEAFSLAATALAAGRSADDCTILAVDRVQAHLDVARTGVNSPLAQRGPVPTWAASAFEPGAGGTIHLCRRGLDMIRWACADITQHELPEACDAVLCRNVAIYLDDAARVRLARSLARSVRDGGLLCLGHADPAPLWEGAFRPIDRAHAFAFERCTTALRRPAPIATTTRVTVRPVTAPAAAPQPAAAPPDSLERARALADEGLLSDAGDMADRLLRDHGVDPSAWQLLGSIRLAQGRDPDAEACFRKVVYLRPDDTLSLLQLSALAERRGDRTGADLLRLRASRSVNGRTA